MKGWQRAQRSKTAVPVSSFACSHLQPILPADEPTRHHRIALFTQVLRARNGPLTDTRSILAALASSAATVASRTRPHACPGAAGPARIRRGTAPNAKTQGQDHGDEKEMSGSDQPKPFVTMEVMWPLHKSTPPSLAPQRDAGGPSAGQSRTPMLTPAMHCLEPPKG